MKYFFVSDLHGCDPKLVYFHLATKGFDAQKDTLVIVGDVVDRGLFTMELVRWINSLPNVIRIWGNHDARTRDIILGIGPQPDRYDKHNGVGATLHSVCGLSPEDKQENIWYYLNAVMPGNPTAKENVHELVDNYMGKCVWALEFPDLIATHAWLPHTHENMNYHLIRPITNLSGLHKNYWIDASWADTSACLRHQLYPGKRMLVGHWWAGDIRARFGLHQLFDDMILQGIADFSTFEYNNVIFIDPCVVVSYTINVYVYETDAAPDVYVTQPDGLVVKMPLSEAGL